MIKTPNQSTTTTISDLDNSKKEKEFFEEVSKALQNLLNENCHTCHNDNIDDKEKKFFNLLHSNCSDSNTSTEEIFKFENYRKHKID